MTSRRSLTVLVPGEFSDVIGNGTASVGQDGRTHCRDAIAGRHNDRLTLGLLNGVTVVAVELERGLHLDLTADLTQTDVIRVLCIPGHAQRSVVPLAPGTQSLILTVLVATVVRAVVALDLLFARLRNVGICK